MTSRSKLLIAAALIIGATSLAQADETIRNTKERVQDRTALARDKAAVVDDRADLNRLSDLVAKWNDARQHGDSQMLKETQLQIAQEIRRDLGENATQTVKAAQEADQAKRELRNSRREQRDDRRDAVAATHNGVPGDARDEKRELREDRRGKRDDRRDYADDLNDLKTAEQLLERKRAIAEELRVVQSKIDGGGDIERLQNRQEELLNQYLATSRREVELGLREHSEDKRELREDRRETREDRRDGDNK